MLGTAVAALTACDRISDWKVQPTLVATHHVLQLRLSALGITVLLERIDATSPKPDNHQHKGQKQQTSHRVCPMTTSSTKRDPTYASSSSPVPM